MSLCHVLSMGESPILHINNIGCSADPQNNRFGPGRRDIWLIHYVVRGKGMFNGHPVHAGQGFLIRRGQMEQYCPDTAQPWEFLWITSDDDRMAAFFDRYPADAQTQIFEYGFSKTIQSIMEYIRAHHNRVLTDAQILELFLHIFNLHSSLLPAGSSNAETYLRFSTDYIQTHLHTPLRIQEITDILGISSAYLHRLFCERFGMSPKQYIIAKKLTAAKELLHSSSLSVTEIAASLGYSDVLAFSRFFSSKAGCSPTAFRQAPADKENGA